MSRRKLEIIGSCPQTQGLHWEAESVLRIGKHESNDIVLNDPSVARRHAEIAVSASGWHVRDVGSTSGTFVNAGRVHGGDYPLRDRDVLRCGNIVFEIAVTNGAQSGTANMPPGVRQEPPEPPSTRPVTRGAGLNVHATGGYMRVQAVAQHSWEQALEAVAVRATPGAAPNKPLLTLLRTGYHLGRIACLKDLLHSILEEAIKALEAQRGAIVLCDENTGRLEARAVSVTNQALDTRRSYSRTLADRCFRQGESILCQDARTDQSLFTAQSVQRGGMASIVCALLRSPRKRLGVLHLDRGHFHAPFTHEDFYLADGIAASAAVGIESAQLVEDQREQFVQTVTALSRAVELRDQFTPTHTRRVTDYSLLLAEELNLSQAERHQLRIGTLLHDIGKIGIDDAILRKPGQLTSAEFEIMKSHTLKGAAILEMIPALWPMVPIARHHHERWDGTGYPDRLAADQIARVARIVTVADAFDAMTSRRPYRPALPAEQAFNELVKKAGTQFDPVCVTAFLRLRPKVQELLSHEGKPDITAGLLAAPAPQRNVTAALNALAAS